MVAALARTNSTLLFDQLLKRPEPSLALLAAMKDGTVTPANLGPANVARLRTHPNRQVAQQAAALLDTLSPGGEGEEPTSSRRWRRRSRSPATRRRAGSSSPAPARAATSSATSARATSVRR